MLSNEIGSLNFIQREQILTRRRLYFEFVRETLLELEREEKLYKIDVATATFTLFGMILWLARWFHSSGKLSIWLSSIVTNV